jgi:branched-subunit amino acid aminotransferase/4-amino-4-deoxychorismate lyase
MDEPVAYLNGRFLPASQLAISPVDAGFLQGAAVAEQLRTFAGKLFCLDEHLARLEQSLQIAEIDPRRTRPELAAIVQELVARNHRLLDPGDDLGLSIFITPGLYPAYAASGLDPDNLGRAPGQPTVGLHTHPLPFAQWAQKYRTGQSLVTTPVEQVPAACWPPALKCRSRMHYYLADRKAAKIEPGARALLLDRDGWVTETSTANILVYAGGQGLVSPPQDSVLVGISLAALARLARQLGIPLGYRRLSPAQVAGAEEAILSSTPWCLLPVTRFNGRPVGSGVPGPVFARLLAAWSETVGVDIAAQAQRFAQRFDKPRIAT